MAQLMYCEKFASKTFIGANTKDAYLKAVKWYASEIIAKDQLHNVQVEFIKSKSTTKPEVTIHMYAVLPEAEVRQQHCACCKEFHKSFFINEESNCNKCNSMAYQKRLEQKIATKTSYYKELLNKNKKGGSV